MEFLEKVVINIPVKQNHEVVESCRFHVDVRRFLLPGFVSVLLLDTW